MRNKRIIQRQQSYIMSFLYLAAGQTRRWLLVDQSPLADAEHVAKGKVATGLAFKFDKSSKDLT